MRFAFGVDERVALGGSIYSLRQKLDGGRWRLEKELNGDYVIKSEEELLELYRSNVVGFIAEHQEELGFEAVPNKIARTFKDYPENLQQQARQRLEIIRKISGVPRSDAAPIICEVADQLDITPPSVQTVYSWLKKYESSGKNICSLVPNYSNRGNRHARYSPEVTEIAVRVISQYYLTDQKKTISAIMPEIRRAIHAAKLIRSETEKLPIPERKFVRNIIAGIDAYEVDRARLGKSVANRKYREANISGERVENPLDRVEIDHTLLDLIVVSDNDYLPIGRPTLTLALDRCTRCICGYHIGYDPPSYIAVMHCLAHAVTPKEYVKKKYPGVVNNWPCWGLMQKLVVDNGAEFHASDFEAAALALLIDVQYCPVRQPWYKGAVERSFRTLNNGLIHQIPGTTFSNIFERGDYKSLKLAVLTESEIHELMHMWIIDVYHQTRHRQTLKTPRQLWQERIPSVIQTLPQSVELLKVNLASTERRTLFHYGISLNNLTYNSPELQKLRRKYGELKMEIKWDRTDLGHIHVVNERENTYLKVPCTWVEYASGLSFWLHKAIRAEALADDKNVESQQEMDAAKERIRKRIEMAMANKKMITRTNAARAKQSFSASVPPARHDIAVSVADTITVPLNTEPTGTETIELEKYEVTSR